MRSHGLIRPPGYRLSATCLIVKTVGNMVIGRGYGPLDIPQDSDIGKLMMVGPLKKERLPRLPFPTTDNKGRRRLVIW